MSHFPAAHVWVEVLSYKVMEWLPGTETQVTLPEIIILCHLCMRGLVRMEITRL